MKIAVLADIHGNHVALEKCLKYIDNQKIDTFVFLGDYIGEMPCPQITMELLYGLMHTKQCYFISGMSIHILRGSCYSHAHGLNLAMEITKDKYGECVWPNIPEECFEEALKEVESVHNGEY